MSTIILHGTPPSSYVRTARMTCAEKNLDHELRPVELGSEAHRKLHPWAKVPILEHGSVRLYETAAIARYLDEAFPGPSLTPKSPLDRARMEQWISALNSYFYGDMIRNYALQYLFPRGANGQPNREVIDPAVINMNRNLDALEHGLEGMQYLADSFSLADIFFAPVLSTVIVFPEGKEAVGARANVKNYLDRLMARPKFIPLSL